MSWTCTHSFSFIPLKASEEKIFEYFLENLPFMLRSVRVAERLAIPTSDHGVAGSNPAGGEILPEP